MITTTLKSRKCGTAYVAVILLLVCLQWISGETISISYGTETDNPEEGDLNYQLDCIISDLDSPAIAWSKDDKLLFWSRERIIDLDTTGEYMIQGTSLNPTHHFILTITQVRKHHSGNYTCFTATGDTLDFNVVQSSAVSVTVIPGTFTPSVTEVPRQTFNRAVSTTSPFESTSVTSTIPSTASEGLPIYVIAAIGAGGGLLLIALISCITAICCCCRCRNRESDIKFEDGGTTRISTGYMWDKELSHMVHESPRPSPKLTNNNHAHVRQALKDPDENDPGMSPSLAYVLANHSDDELDSNDGDLKKPVSAAYETADLNPAGRVLKHGASVHSNLYASKIIAAPTPPMSSNPSADFPPTYAVPDKNKYPSSRADDDATPTETQRSTEEHVNAAYDPNEGFVENGIYEPAAR